MILGIGSDITDARRIAKVIERHGDRFLDRVFTPIERARADKRRNRVETYAKRFAAKEACAKAPWLESVGLKLMVTGASGLLVKAAVNEADVPVSEVVSAVGVIVKPATSVSVLVTLTGVIAWPL